jgi:predicted DNA-binding ribbon-helix-helix protein
MESVMMPSLGCDVPADDDKNADTSKVPPNASTLVSRNVTVAGHRTSVRLEPEMWSGLTEICRRERMIMHDVCTIVASHKKKNTSLTAAIRVFVVTYYKAAATEDGHSKAGHGYGGIMAVVPSGPAVAPRTGGHDMSSFATASGKMNNSW